jgi:pepF/M3 family oligoendopeptidase
MSDTKYPVTWNLATLSPDPTTDEFRRNLDQLKKQLAEFAASTTSLPPVDSSPDNVARWVHVISQYELMDGRMTDLRALIECYAAADAENKFYQQLQAELATLTPFREQIATNVEFAFKEATDDGFVAFAAAAPELQRNQYFLETRRRNASLRLPKALELLAGDLAVDGLHAWGRLFDRVSGALKVRVQEKGELVTRSPSQVQFDSPQRQVRENNFFAVDSAWAGIADTCADAINHISGTRLSLYRHAGLRDHLEVPLRSNRMSRETLDSMWSAITDRKGVLKEYLAKKAQLLGIDKLAWYDMTAPLPQLPGAGGADVISYDDACERIINAFQLFSSDFGDFARKALSEGWIEAENRSGKHQGGFCTTFPTAKQSRIFMTYTNSADSMSTLAHELGHAYHSWVLRDQPILLQDYPMNLAETASTFAEAVLGEQQFRLARTDYERLQMLDGLLGDAVAFLMNIHARFLFEDQFHRDRLNGELTADQLNALMESSQRTAYLDALDDNGWNPRFWASKLHFYITGLPFYNFPYTFGYLLSLGVYAVGKDSGGEFAETYRKLLIATGCKDAEDAVRSTLGFDLRKPDFWNKSLNIIADRVRQFVVLADATLEKTTRI